MAVEPARPTQSLAQQFLRLSLVGSRLEWARAEAAALAPRLDWPEVRRQAEAERLEPLLYHILKGHSGLPAEVLAAWRQTLEQTRRRNLAALFELARVIRRLRERQIEVLVLKGAALIPTVYGDLGLRPLRDLDLLVRRADLEPALAALATLDYERLGLEPQAGSLAAYESQARLRKRGPTRTLVEIHWSLFDSPHYQSRLDLDWFWDTRTPVEISGVAAQAPGPSAHLLYLAGHLWLHHHGTGLLWWHDMAELVSRSPQAVDWDALLRWAEAYDLALPLQHVLANLARDWGAPAPADVLARLERLQPSAAGRRVFEGLGGAGRPAGPRLWLDLTSMPGWRRRLRFAWSNLLPSARYMRMRYNIRHGLLTPLYYPYRWLLGIRSALWKV